jgi:hypothetical protein
MGEDIHKINTNLILLTGPENTKSETGQSYYGPKARKPHDSYGFLHYGKNCNDVTYYEENRTNRVVSLFLARNSFDPFQTSHGMLHLIIF